MPRRQSLKAIVPNRFYQIDATLKYQHIGQNSITGIIQQNQVQTKICIPKDGIQLQQGKQYTFGKCFNSKNGWLYARNPSETIVQKSQSSLRFNLITLKDIYENRQSYSSHYVSTQLKVISIQPKHSIQKKGQTLILYKLRCFAEGLTVNVQIWNQQIKKQNAMLKVLNFIGFKIKQTSHSVISLVSGVYSKIQEPSQQITNMEKFNFDKKILYTNISSVYQIRNIQTIHKVCQNIHKNYSITSASVNFMEQLNYEGCSNCRRKTGQNGCFQCGADFTKTNIKYIKVLLEDQSGFLECAIFNQQSQEISKQLYGLGEAAFKIKSSAKINHQTQQVYLSHVASILKSFVDQE